MVIIALWIVAILGGSLPLALWTNAHFMNRQQFPNISRIPSCTFKVEK